MSGIIGTVVVYDDDGNPQEEIVHGPTRSHRFDVPARQVDLSGEEKSALLTLLGGMGFVADALAVVTDGDVGRVPEPARGHLRTAISKVREGLGQRPEQPDSQPVDPA